jgi:hypothetical protein
VEFNGGYVMPIADLDPSMNARSVCKFRDCSLPTLNRDVRSGRFPPPDFTSGPYRYWKSSTVIRHREHQITASAAQASALREKQLDQAAEARRARQDKRKTANTEQTAA